MRDTLAVLAARCLHLDEERTALDRRLVAITSNAAEWPDLWQELEHLLTTLEAVIDRMARMPAKGTADLAAKAAVLELLLNGDRRCSVLLPDTAMKALASSLVGDISRLFGPSPDASPIKTP